MSVSTSIAGPFDASGSSAYLPPRGRSRYLPVTKTAVPGSPPWGCVVRVSTIVTAPLCAISSVPVARTLPPAAMGRLTSSTATNVNRPSNGGDGVAHGALLTVAESGT